MEAEIEDIVAQRCEENNELLQKTTAKQEKLRAEIEKLSLRLENAKQRLEESQAKQTEQSEVLE